MTSAAPLLLLDTHVWLWFALGDTERLATPVRKRIVAATHGGTLVVSAISVWEIGMLEAKGRIVLGMPCEKWVTTALTLPGLRLIGLEPEIAIASSHLPGEIHGDPATRRIASWQPRPERAMLCWRPQTNVWWNTAKPGLCECWM